MQPKECEICGYRAKVSTIVVLECADSIWRCKKCLEKSMYGRVIPDRELRDDSPMPPITDEWCKYIDDITERP